MKKYALIIDGCYCGRNTIVGVYDTLYDAIIAARNWIDDHFVANEWSKLIEDFVDNDFLWVEDYFNICEFEI